MNFGLFLRFRFPEPWSAEKERQCLWDHLEQATFAEEMGFSSLWVSEQHFLPAWSMNSAPEVLLSAISQRTSKVHLGVAVVTSPIHHPIHTAARMSTLDLLSNGRVYLGLGRATTPLQLAPFGVKLEDTQEMLHEALSIIPRMWTEEVFSHEGKYYHIPPCEVVPKPFQQPYPPIWVASTQEDTLQLAGKLGMGCLIHGAVGPERAETIIGKYKAASQEATTVGNFVNNRVIADLFTYCDENDKRAREKSAEWLASKAVADNLRNAKQWKGVREEDVPPEYIRHFRAAQQKASSNKSDVTPQMLQDTGSGYCIGDPDACIRTAERYEALGVDELILALNVGPSAPQQEVMNTIRLFGKYVIPHFKETENQTQASSPSAG